jgi:hypothetical protein
MVLNMGRPTWIIDVIATPEVEDKIWVKHHLTLDEVRSAVCLGAQDEERWDMHVQYGKRLIVKGRSAGGVRLIVFLYEVDGSEDIWRCTTAMRESELYG